MIYCGFLLDYLSSHVGLFAECMRATLLIIRGTVAQVLMIMFGLWTVKHNRRLRIAASLANSRGGLNERLMISHPTDRQFIRLLLFNSAIYIAFNRRLSSTRQKILHLIYSHTYQSALQRRTNSRISLRKARPDKQ